MTEEPEKAVILLLAAYYTVNVNFTGPCKQALVALSCGVLTPDNVDVEYASNGRFLERLRKLGIDL